MLAAEFFHSVGSENVNVTGPAAGTLAGTLADGATVSIALTESVDPKCLAFSWAGVHELTLPATSTICAEMVHVPGSLHRGTTTLPVNVPLSAVPLCRLR